MKLFIFDVSKEALFLRQLSLTSILLSIYEQESLKAAWFEIIDCLRQIPVLYQK